VNDLKYKINQSPILTKIIFGNNTNTFTNKVTLCGTMPASVVANKFLADNLVSANPLIDSGNIILLNSKGGYIYNPETGRQANITREGPRFIVWLQDIEQLTKEPNSDTSFPTDGDTISAYSNRIIKLTSTIEEKVIWLHEVTGHVDKNSMCKAISGSNPTWIQNPGVEVTTKQIRKVFETYSCLHCIVAKQNIISPTNKVEDYTKYKPAEVISCDLVGKINPPTTQGHVWFFLFKCIRTGHLQIITSRSKEGFLDALKQILNWYVARGWKPKVLRSDNDTVILSSEIQEYLITMGMVQQNSAPYRQFQNSVERDMQTLQKGVSLFLHAQPWLRADLWDLAAHHWVDCRNRTINVHNQFKSPIHILTKRPTNLINTFQFAFGDLVVVGIPKDLRTWKFDLRNDVGIYVGQPSGMVDASYIYWPHTHSVSIRGSVTKLEISDEAFLSYYQRRKEVKEGPLPYKTWEITLRDLLADKIKDSELSTQEGVSSQQDTTVDFEQQLQLSPDSTSNKPLSAPLFEAIDAEPDTRRNLKRIRTTMQPRTMQTRSSTQGSAAQKASVLTDSEYDTGITSNNDCLSSHLHEAVKAYAAKISSRRALEGIDKIKWQQAIETEVKDNMFKTGTLFEEKPHGIKGTDYTLIHSTMQLKIKLNDDGTIEKYKARLCARGDMLAGSIEETYSPTISALAYATAHQIAIIDGMFTCTVDTVGAYLYEDYPTAAKPLYLKLEPHIAIALGRNPEATYRIRKYLYGLPDSGRAYYKGYSAHIIKHGYKRTVSDPCLFVKINDDSRTYVWIHVDDTFVASNRTHELLEFQRIVGLKYEYTVQNDVESYLGIHMTKLKDGSIRLTQPKLLADIFAEFIPEAMPGTNKVTAPRSKISDQEWDQTPIQRTKYLHLLGALLYVTKSRPDIATAVSFAATYAISPTKGAYDELLQCVQYLYRTQEVGLILRTGIANAELKLKCYVDASYLTHNDSKSHTGYCLSLGDMGTFYSKSMKQTLMTTSSTHAEMRALYQLILEIIYIINLCDELDRPLTLPAIVMEDNQPVIDLSTDLTKRSKKCKHFLMLINFVREQVESGLIEIHKIPTEDNLADILTKIVTGWQFIEKAEPLLGMTFANLLQKSSE
jgi:hypothetical protein